MVRFLIVLKTTREECNALNKGGDRKEILPVEFPCRKSDRTASPLFATRKYCSAICDA